VRSSPVTRERNQRGFEQGFVAKLQ